MSASFNVPILFLIFNRPDTTRKVFERIREIRPSQLFVAADGPRTSKPGEQQLCEETRKVIQTIDWECEIKTLFRDKNLGCGIAVSSAISWFFEQVEYGIILEDDCLPNKSFFRYCDELLLKYKDDNDVMLIGGNNFLNKSVSVSASYYFSQYPHIWGWASWRRAWKNYDLSMKDLDAFKQVKIKSIFKTKKQKRYLLSKLYKTQKGNINTWDYQWVYSILANQGVAITPGCNLVENIGFRNQSTHTFLKDSIKEYTELTEMQFPLRHPNKKINFDADLRTFDNVFSREFKRLFRLVRENGPISIIKYVVNN